MDAAARATAALRPATWPNCDDGARAEYLAAAGRYHDIRRRLDDGPNDELVRLAAGTPSAGDVDYAIEFLELDPYFFRSGYIKARVGRHLARTPLDAASRARVQAYVRRVFAGDAHCASPTVGKLARATADNALRRDVRAQLRSGDPRRALLALEVCTYVRHPGLTESDLAIAREIALDEAVRFGWPGRRGQRLTRFLWCEEWAAELRDVAAIHGPRRAVAKRMLEYAERRRQRKHGR
jgi:hypothetical protein